MNVSHICSYAGAVGAPDPLRFGARIAAARRVALYKLWIKALAFVYFFTHVAQGGDNSAIDFNRDIRPILSNNCFKCHGPDEASRQSELRIDTREGALADRGGYSAINPDEPAASALLSRVKATEESERMPPVDSGLQLSADQIELLSRWIEQGASFEPHWAFRLVQQPPVPAGASSWPRNEIDAFVLAQLNEQQIAPSLEATPYTLIRRVYLDVLGLPPTLAEVEQFIADQSSDAYARMVDRALASPHYGERWGRHWLDQARYADTNGYSVDAERSMWPYRDWVIGALNDDMPFDQFTIEQLAGDLLPIPSREQLVATGFHRNTLINEEGGTDDEQFRVESVVDRVNTTGTVWLGLTVGCAQCHTHKFDPISQQEYYELFAFFNNCEDANGRPPTLHLASPEQQTKLDELDARIGAATTAIAQYDKQHSVKPAEGAEMAGGAAATADAQRAELNAELTRLQEDRTQHLASIPQTMILRELSTPRESNVLIRGDFLRKGVWVLPATPTVLPELPASEGRPTRLDLARWLVDRQNPLTARVAVNRVWAHYFGRGLVETENDFGLQGTPPTHPKLLDWLAAEFMDRRWSQKHLHRLILNSATYRQSSQHRAELAEVDSLNKLLGRQSRLRVDAEIVRDLALAVSGLLYDKIGGPGAYPPQPADVFAFTQVQRPWPTSTGPDRYRRGMYTFFMRSAPYPMLTTFDSPVFNVTCTFRHRSNTPLQSLAMANDETMIEAARALGQRTFQHAATDEDRIGFAYRLCFARPPDPFELERLAEYVEQQRQSFASNPDDALLFAGEIPIKPAEEAAAWTALGRVLLNLDEFITRE